MKLKRFFRVEQTQDNSIVSKGESKMSNKQTILDEYNHPKNMRKCEVCGELVQINEAHSDEKNDKKRHFVCEQCRVKMDRDAKCQVILG